MEKFKANQTVYYYYSTGEFMGEIVQAHIVSIYKDLTTKEITYNIKSDLGVFPGWMNDYTFTLKGENLYSSYKKIVEDYKDEIAYNALKRRMDDLEKVLHNVVSDYAEKVNNDSLNGKYLTVTDSCLQPVSIRVDGIGDLKEEFTKIKKEVENLKKKIKTPRKKPVIKEEKKAEEKTNE